MILNSLRPTVEKVIELYRDAKTTDRRLYIAGAVMWWAWRAGSIPEMAGRPWWLVVHSTDASAAIGIVAGHEPETIDWLKKMQLKLSKPNLILIRIGRDTHTKLPSPPNGVQLIDLRG